MRLNHSQTPGYKVIAQGLECGNYVLMMYSSKLKFKTQCEYYIPYAKAPEKEMSHYDFVLIDGICKHTVAHTVLIGFLVIIRLFQD